MHNEPASIPQWLKNLQENSWELELLISGGAIFSLFQLSDQFLDMVFVMKMTSFLPGLSIFIITGMLGLKLLTVGFILHLLLRAFWLGMVCINYVFPQGIREGSWKIQRPFKSWESDSSNLRDEIIQIDNASGVVMFSSIVATFVLVGVILNVLVFITLPITLLDAPNAYVSFILWAGLVYYLDLVTFGLIRKTPYLSYVAYPFFWAFDTITLRPLYAKSLRLFGSNVKKLKTILGFVLILIVSGFMTYISVYRIMRWPNIIDSRSYRFQMAPEENWQNHTYYRDHVLEEGVKFSGPCIQSEIINDGYLQIFIPYNRDFEVDLQEDEVLSDYVQLSIDDSSIHEVEWFSFWSKDIDQIGIKAHVDITKLSHGRHTLGLGFDTEEGRHMSIPFWKDERGCGKN